jgi:hypothetical protein
MCHTSVYVGKWERMKNIFVTRNFAHFKESGIISTLLTDIQAFSQKTHATVWVIQDSIHKRIV